MSIFWLIRRLGLLCLTVEGAFCVDASGRVIESMHSSTRFFLRQFGQCSQNYTIDLQRPVRREFLCDIRSGRKIFEGRVAKPDFDNYLQDKVVKWTTGEESVLTRIVGRRWYPSFKEMLLDVGYHKFLPRAASVSEADSIYLSFPGYLEGEKQYGVLALEIRVLPLA